MAFGYLKSFTADHTQCGGSDTSGFPAVVFRTDGDFASVANGGQSLNASGYDIRPYSDSGLSSALAYQLVSYNATTGAIELWVNLPTLSHTSDVVSYMGIGDVSLVTDGSSTSTWDSNYFGVYHFQEGTGTTAHDSSQAGLDLGFHGTAATWTAAGQIGKGFSGTLPASGSGLQNATTTLQTTSDFTTELWLNYSTGQYTASTDNAFLGQWAGGSGWMAGYATGGSGTYRIYCNGSFATFTSVTPNDQAWHHVLCIKSGGNARMVVDGVDTGNTAIGASTISSASSPLDAFTYSALGGTNFYGLADELRGSKIARSVDYAIACFNNQKASSTFLSWGSLTPAGGGGTTLSPTGASLGLAVATAILALGLVASAAVAALSGGTPSLVIAAVRQPVGASLTLAGGTPALSQGTVRSPAGGALVLSGGTPSLQTAGSLNPTGGSLALAGGTPILDVRYPASSGALALAAGTPQVFTGATFQPSAGSLALAGGTPKVDVTYPAIGAVASLQGGTPSLVIGTVRAPSGTSCSLAGGSSHLDFGLVAPSGGLALAGGTPTVTVSSGTFVALAGALNLTGGTPSLTVTIVTQRLADADYFYVRPTGGRFFRVAPVTG